MQKDESKLLQCSICSELLRDPVLLQCLHSCCAECLDREVTAGDGGTLFRCPACKVVTDVASKSSDAFLAARVSLCRAARDAEKCSFCASDGNPSEAVANVWCEQCQTYLCSDCLPGHSKYNKHHVVIALSDQDSSIHSFLVPAAVRCPVHGKSVELLCLSCHAVHCIDCSSECFVAGHNVEPIKSPFVDAYFARAREGIAQLTSTLECKADLLLRHANWPTALDVSRMEDIERLKKRKVRILAAFEKAFATASDALYECYDTLAARAASLDAETDLLTKQVGQALSYSGCLVRSGHVVGLLQHEDLLCSRLAALSADVDGLKPPVERVAWSESPLSHLVALSAEVTGMKPPFDSSKYGAWSELPTKELDELASALMGRPMLKADDHSHNASEAAAAGATPDADTCNRNEPLLFKAITSNFKSCVPCNAIAMTSDGSLLLAAMEHGLKEFDFGGKQLSHWLPEEKRPGTEEDDWVTVVASLEDGRAAVGVFFAHRVMLLKRIDSTLSLDMPASAAVSSQWAVEHVVVQLQSPASQLSSWEYLLAIGQCQRNDKLNQWVAGPQLILQTLDGQCKLQKKLDYGIQGLAITSRSIVTSSCMKVKEKDGRELHVVDCYSHDGQRLLRLKQSELVFDVCSAPSGRVLYLSLLHSDIVVAISSDDGRLLATVMSSSSHGLKRPGRLALNPGEPPVLAVLSVDWNSVYVSEIRKSYR